MSVNSHEDIPCAEPLGISKDNTVYVVHRTDQITSTVNDDETIGSYFQCCQFVCLSSCLMTRQP